MDSNPARHSLVSGTWALTGKSETANPHEREVAKPRMWRHSTRNGYRYGTLTGRISRGTSPVTSFSRT
jgi:hypothetical protein